MDFKKRITEELKLSKFQAEILFDEYIIVCEKLAKEYHTEQLRIGGVRHSSWIKFEETKFVEDGIYPVKTNEGRIISAERFKGSWMEYDTPIKDNESVVSYYA